MDRGTPLDLLGRLLAYGVSEGEASYIAHRQQLLEIEGRRHELES